MVFIKLKSEDKGWRIEKTFEFQKDGVSFVRIRKNGNLESCFVPYSNFEYIVNNGQAETNDQEKTTDTVEF